MFLRAAAISDLGCVREKNEDNFICNQYVKDMEQSYAFVSRKPVCSDWRPVAYGVFDGMGGYQKGELSSYFAAQNVKEAVRKIKNQDIEKEINLFYQKTNQEICNYMTKYNIRTGTTAALMYIYQDNIYYSNLGDSPIFRLRNGKMEEMYEEHTERRIFQILNQDLVKNKKYKLTQHLGIFMEELMIEPYIKRDKLVKNDIYIICSDGLTDMVDKEQIQEILQNEQKPKCIVKKLLNAAKEAGGNDNITIICVKS